MLVTYTKEEEEEEEEEEYFIYIAFFYCYPIALYKDSKNILPIKIKKET